MSVNEGYVKAISGLFNLSERELAHFHNHHLAFPDPPRCFAAEPPLRDSNVCVDSETTSSSSPDLSSLSKPHLAAR